METLDFGEIMERNELWWEEYDLICPYCNGDPDRKCQTCDEGLVKCPDCDGVGQIDDHKCPECDGTGYWACNDCDGTAKTYCECCDEGYFAVMWNTAFEVQVWDDFLDVERNSAKWQDSYKFAWDMGFCLIEHGRKRYLLMGMCGQDCTWIIHYTRWKLQGFLDQEDCYQCIGSGGYVFLPQGKRHELCEYMKGRLTPPKDYAKGYERNITKIAHIDMT